MNIKTLTLTAIFCLTIFSGFTQELKWSKSSPYKQEFRKLIGSDNNGNFYSIIKDNTLKNVITIETIDDNLEKISRKEVPFSTKEKHYFSDALISNGKLFVIRKYYNKKSEDGKRIEFFSQEYDFNINIVGKEKLICFTKDLYLSNIDLVFSKDSTKILTQSSRKTDKQIELTYKVFDSNFNKIWSKKRTVPEVKFYDQNDLKRSGNKPDDHVILDNKGNIHLVFRTASKYIEAQQNSIEKLDVKSSAISFIKNGNKTLLNNLPHPNKKVTNWKITLDNDSNIICASYIISPETNELQKLLYIKINITDGKIILRTEHALKSKKTGVRKNKDRIIPYFIKKIEVLGDNSFYVIAEQGYYYSYSYAGAPTFNSAFAYIDISLFDKSGKMIKEDVIKKTEGSTLYMHRIDDKFYIIHNDFEPKKTIINNINSTVQNRYSTIHYFNGTEPIKRIIIPMNLEDRSKSMCDLWSIGTSIESNVSFHNNHLIFVYVAMTQYLNNASSIPVDRNYYRYAKMKLN